MATGPGDRLVEEQAALRRVATLVADGASPEEVFAAVAAEVGKALAVDRTVLMRYGADEAVTVGGWARSGTALHPGRRLPVGGQNLTTVVLRTGRPARIDRYDVDAGAAPVAAIAAGMRAAVGVPISVEGRLWGAMIVAVTGERALPGDVEARLAAFTELVATAVANAQARVELRTSAEEQAALRRVATLVARGVTAEEVFAAVTAEVGRALGADFTGMNRYDGDDTATAVGLWSRTAAPSPLSVGDQLRLGGNNLTTLVHRTGRSARLDGYADASGAHASAARAWGFAAAVGVPISVEGRLWGMVSVGYVRPDALPVDAEARLAGFTELIGSAIANAQARVELRGFAEEQAALRRMATLVAEAAAPEEVFTAVTAEVGRVLGSDYASLSRYDEGPVVTVLGAWNRTGEALVVPIGARVPLGGRNVTTEVFETGRPARIDDYAGVTGTVGDLARGGGARASVGVPIVVQGRVWGLMNVFSRGPRLLPPDSEARLARFTELVATAVANAQARVELRGFAEQQAALRRVATLVARGAAPEDVFAAVTAEVGRVVGCDNTVMSRYDSDDTATVVAEWTADGGTVPDPVGRRLPLGERNVTTLVARTHRPARLDRYGADAGALPAAALAAGVTTAAGAPIDVEGRLWGVMIAASRGSPLPADTESRLAGFTELVATAVANAEAQAQLSASRARIVATTDATRRRIERDLHDGVQQHLVSLSLRVRTAQSKLPPGAAAAGAELDAVAGGLTGLLEELREITRGIHPAALAQAGLRPALRALARRCPIPVQLDVDVEGRLPEPVELAAYYTVAEALTNAAKHARASVVDVCAVADGQVLRIEVRDDGRGGATVGSGSGLVGLTDRIEALGGRLTLNSPPGAGTTLQITLPLRTVATPVDPGGPR